MHAVGPGGVSRHKVQGDAAVCIKAARSGSLTEQLWLARTALWRIELHPPGWQLACIRVGSAESRSAANLKENRGWERAIASIWLDSRIQSHLSEDTRRSLI